MKYDISTVRVPAQRVVSIRSRIRESDVPDFIGSAFAEIYGFLTDSFIEPSGHPCVLYHEFGSTIDAEAAVPIDRDVTMGGRMAVRTLPATTVARTVHVGPYERLGDAYAALAEWASERDLTAAGPVREHYLTGVADAVSPDLYRTRLEMPVMPVAAAIG